MVMNKTGLLKLPVLKQTDSSQLHSSVKIECMHENATCWCSSGNYLTGPMLLGCRNPSVSDVPLDMGQLTTVQVDTCTLR
jgi:hypothetical protein